MSRAYSEILSTFFAPANPRDPLARIKGTGRELGEAFINMYLANGKIYTSLIGCTLGDSDANTIISAFEDYSESLKKFLIAEACFSLSIAVLPIDVSSAFYLRTGALTHLLNAVNELQTAIQQPLTSLGGGLQVLAEQFNAAMIGEDNLDNADEYQPALQ